jgi:hypothetical protein
MNLQCYRSHGCPHHGPCRPCQKEESALTESENLADCGLRGVDLFKRSRKMPDSDEDLPWSPILCTFAHLELRILMAGAYFLPAHVQRHLPVLALRLILRALMRVQKKARIAAHPNYIRPSILLHAGKSIRWHPPRDRNPDASMVPPRASRPLPIPSFIPFDHRKLRKAERRPTNLASGRSSSFEGERWDSRV